MDRSEQITVVLKDDFDIDAMVQKTYHPTCDIYEFIVSEGYDQYRFRINFCHKSPSMDALSIKDYLSTCASSISSQPMYGEDHSTLAEMILFEYEKDMKAFYDTEKNHVIIIHPDEAYWYLKRHSRNNLWDIAQEDEMKDTIAQYVSQKNNRSVTDPIQYLPALESGHPRVDRIRDTVLYAPTKKSDYSVVISELADNVINYKEIGLGHAKYSQNEFTFNRGEDGNIEMKIGPTDPTPIDPVISALLRKKSFLYTPLLSQAEKEFLSAIPGTTSDPKYAGENFFVSGIGEMYVNIGIWMAVTQETIDNADLPNSVKNEISLWKNLSDN